MYILFLGPQCLPIENALQSAGHTIMRREEPFDIAFLEQHQFDFGISYGFRHIIHPAEIIWFKNKLINLHISYLPWNRGADPNFWSWRDNTPKGISIHRVDTGIDTGEILLQKKIKFDNVQTETLRTSYEKLSRSIELLLIKNLNLILTNKIETQQQNGKGTFHSAKDKIPLLFLIKKKCWDTPVLELTKEKIRDSLTERH